MEALEITYLDGDGGLRLAGELDMHTARQLKDAFANVGNSGRATLDLSEVTFIDSSGLHAIVECARAQDGSGPLILVGASEITVRLLEITDLVRHPDLEIR